MLRNDRWTGFLWFAVHFSASALWLWMHIEAISGADLLGDWKWMWKLNHVLNCTTEQRSLLGSHTGETGGGGTETGGKKKKKKASIVSVYPPHCSYIQHAAHWLLVDWQKEELAIKMVIFSPPLHTHIILVSKKRIADTLKCCMAQSITPGGLCSAVTLSVALTVPEEGNVPQPPWSLPTSGTPLATI